MSKTCAFFFLTVKYLSLLQTYQNRVLWPLVSTDQGCQDSGHLFLLIIWRKMQIKAASYLLVYRIGKYLKWRYYAVLMRVQGIGELVELVGVQISSIILKSDLTSCSKSWRKEPGGIPLLRIFPNRIILGMLKDLSICIFIGTLFNKRKIKKKREMLNNGEMFD